MRRFSLAVALFLPTLGSGCTHATPLDPTWAAYEQQYKATKGNRTQSENSTLIIYKVQEY